MEKEKEEQKISTLLDDLSSLEDYVRNLFTFLPLPVCFVSSIGIILEANPALEEISGYSIEDLIGKPVEDIFSKGEIKKIFKETIEKGSVQTRELSIFTKQKRKIPISVSTTLRKNEEGEIIGYFIGFFDLSSIKIKENELRDARLALLNMLEDSAKDRERAEEAKNQTLAIIANFADGLLVFDQKNKLSLINPRAENFLNIKGIDVIGRSILELSSHPALEPLINLVGKEINIIFRKELSIKENFILEISTISIMSGKKRLGSLIILHDITREKMIEKMKTEFVSLAAHQLRTPLSAIKWTLKMFLDGDIGKITQEQKAYLEKTFSANERMIDLINDLLNITRIEEGRYLYNPELVDFQEAVQFVINSRQDLIKKKKMKFKFNAPETKLPPVRVDLEKMRLVVQNLLDNAISYTSTGGEITISLKKDRDKIEFSIKDNGIGIPEDQKDRIFTKFFRSRVAVSKETRGTGLGLYLSKNIIEAHGGKIWFESKEGRGSTFYFTLPVAKESKEHPAKQ